VAATNLIAKHESSGRQSQHNSKHDQKLRSTKKTDSRLTLGDPIAPWLFDLQYLLPEAPLLLPVGSVLEAKAANTDEPEPSPLEIDAFKRLFGLEDKEDEEEEDTDGSTTAAAIASPVLGSSDRVKEDTPMVKGRERREAKSQEEDRNTLYEQPSSRLNYSSNMSEVSLSVLFQSLWAAELGASLHFSEAQDRFNESRDSQQRASGPSKDMLLQYVTRTAHKHEPDAPATVSSVLSRSLTAEQQREISVAYRAFKTEHDPVTAAPAVPAQPLRSWRSSNGGIISLGSPKPVPIAPALEGKAYLKDLTFETPRIDEQAEDGLANDGSYRTGSSGLETATATPHAPLGRPMPSFSPRRK
jgi:hypothetical protein